jgi:predicted nucleic acid-binding Zn ribbon protein
MIDFNETKKFKCHKCGNTMNRTIKQVMDKALGNCDECNTKIELMDVDGLRTRAAKDIERIKKDFKKY